MHWSVTIAFSLINSLGFGDAIWVLANIGSGYGLLPDGNKP